MLLAAPTGSGKTVCAEIAILRLIMRKGPKARCVYVAPLKSLVLQRFRDWKPKFQSKLGVHVDMLTGETGLDLRKLQVSQIVLSTPEHWDRISRRWKLRTNVQNVQLFIVDELHLIGGNVGPTLEVIVSRMRYMASQLDNPVRIVALLASVANAKDLADWIGAKAKSRFIFHPDVRPVPLEIRIRGFHSNHYPSRQLQMVKPAYLAIKKHAQRGKPVIIFVSSRTYARRVAVDFMTMADSEAKKSQFLAVPVKTISPMLKEVKNKTLHETLSAGVAFYHKGMYVCMYV